MVNGENLIEQCAIKPRTFGNKSGNLNDTEILQIKNDVSEYKRFNGPQ